VLIKKPIPGDSSVTDSDMTIMKIYQTVTKQTLILIKHALSMAWTHIIIQYLIIYTGAYNNQED